MKTCLMRTQLLVIMVCSPFTGLPLEHSRAPLAIATCRACASRSRVSWDSVCVSADDLCVCLSAKSNSLDSSEVRVARESICRSDRRPNSPFSFRMVGSSKKTWGRGRKGTSVVSLHVDRTHSNRKQTNLKNTEVECREKRPHVRLTLAGAVGQSQLFVSPVGQRRFYTPAHQTTQWRDIKGVDWLVPGEGCVQEGDEDEAEVILDP